LRYGGDNMKKRYVEIRRGGGGKLMTDDIGLLVDEVTEMFMVDEVGETVTLTIVEISEEEYKNLPEFEGW